MSLVAVTLSLVGSVALVAPASAQEECSDVEVIFARGTSERPGLGIVGRPFVAAVESALPDRTVSSYAVDYPASFSQNAASGATDMSDRVAEVAAQCPDTQFVIGGYSQGASVTSQAVGIRTGGSQGRAIRADLAPRVVAVVVYGNPLGARGRSIASESPTYGPKAAEYCNRNDSICGRGDTSGSHFSYPSNGTVPDGAEFAAARVG